MFTIDPDITDLKVREKGIYKMLFSLNTHQVATPEMSVEDARCYIILFREGGNLSAYIGMYLSRTDKRYYYAYSANPFPFEAAAEVEGETRGFAEDMGFLLDEVNISAMSPEERNRWIEEQAIFGQKKAPEPKPAPVPAVEIIPQPVQEPVAAATVPQAAPQPQPPVQPQQQAQAQPQPKPRLQKSPEKPAPPQKPASVVARRAETLPPVEAAPTAAVKRPDDIMSQAIKSGVVKPPQTQLKKDIRSATGVVGKDMEALARLFASF